MRNCNQCEHPEIRDNGRRPFVFNIRHATNMNRNFRTALWTGGNLQLTLMSIPAGTWHNIVNIGNRPLKVYSLYAPPNHPFGTVHKTKSDAEHKGH